MWISATVQALSRSLSVYPLSLILLRASTKRSLPGHRPSPLVGSRRRSPFGPGLTMPVRYRSTLNTKEPRSDTNRKPNPTQRPSLYLARRVPHEPSPGNSMTI